MVQQPHAGVHRAASPAPLLRAAHAAVSPGAAVELPADRIILAPAGKIHRLRLLCRQQLHTEKYDQSYCEYLSSRHILCPSLQAAEPTRPHIMSLDRTLLPWIFRHKRTDSIRADCRGISAYPEIRPVRPSHLPSGKGTGTFRPSPAASAFRHR